MITRRTGQRPTIDTPWCRVRSRHGPFFPMGFVLTAIMLASSPVAGSGFYSGTQLPFTTTEERSWIAEAEFVNDPNLHATLDQTVVLDLEGEANRGRGNGSSQPVRNIYRFSVDSPGERSFCIPEDEPFIRRIELRQTFIARHGSPPHHEGGHRKPRVEKRLVYRHPLGTPCKPVSLKPGTYEVSIFHDGSRIGSKARKAFLHLPGRSRTFGETTVDDTPVAFGRPDFIAFRGPNGAIVTDEGTDIAPIPLMSTKSVVGPTEVFRLSWSQSNRGKWRFGMHDGNGLPVLYLSAPDECAPDHRIYVGPDHGGLYCEDSGVSMIPNDHGGGAFDLFMRGGGPIAVNALTELYNLPETKEFPGDTMQLLYKGFNSDDFTLQKGEVAFYAQCDYESPAIVFSTDTPSLAIFEQAATAGLGVSPTTALALRVGPDTLVSVYAQSNYQGEAVNVGADTPCLSEVQVTAVQSIQILDRDDYIVSSQGCVRCVLNGINFDGEDLSGYDFTDTLFNAASLLSVRFHATDLQGSSLHQIQVDSMTDFTGATLKCSSFVAADLTQAIFGNNIYQADGSCLTSLERATIDYSQFETSLWRNLDLTASNVTNVPDTLSTMSNPLDLSGTVLDNVKWLQGKRLDYANLGCYPLQPGQNSVCPAANGTRRCTSLNGADLGRTSFAKSCFSDARLQGTVLSFANLDGANLSGVSMFAEPGGSPATLRGAFMRNVTLDSANLSGVIATNANFYAGLGGSASAQNIVAPNIDFSNAYLAGADFTGENTNLQRSSWSNAVLVGTKFQNADLSGDSTARAISSFEGAYMQGADFGGTQSTLTADADFSDSYWNLSTSATLNFLLPTANLEFKGYWKAGACLAEPTRLCSQSSDCGSGDVCSFPTTGEGPAGTCQASGTACNDDSACGSTDTCVASPECVSALYSATGTAPITDINNFCPDTGKGPCDGRWEMPLTPISEAVPRSAVSPALPKEPGSSLQCIQADFTWLFASP